MIGVFTLCFLQKAILYIFISFLCMLFQKEKFIKKKKSHIPHSNSDWLLCPFGSSFASLTVPEENAFSSSWNLWAPVFLNSAQFWQRQKIYSAADLQVNHPEGEMAREVHGLLGWGQNKICGSTMHLTFCLQQMRFMQMPFKNSNNTNRCVLKPRTAAVQQVQDAASACQTVGKLIPSLYDQTNKGMLNPNNEYQKNPLYIL